MKTKDITGKNFGRLTALKFQYIKNNHYYWLFKCSCGNCVVAEKGHVVAGHIKSCGCYNKDVLSKRQKTHGLSKTKLYRTYKNIKTRCYDKNVKAYKLYGGRGIIMCDEWKNNFVSFYNWSIQNGYNEKSNRKFCTIDRIDNDGNYCPENCRWVTQKEQCRNKRNNFKVNGMCLSEYCEKNNLDYDITYRKFKKLLTNY